MFKMKLIFLTLIIMSLNNCAKLPPVTHYKKYSPTQANLEYIGPIDFYSRSKPFGEFSNFAYFPIRIEGKVWPTSEHYYQAYKYETEEMREKVRVVADPGEAAKIGRNLLFPKRKNWHEIKDQYMWTALKAKYTQHGDLRELLLSTGINPIYEHTKNDCYWGDCGDRTGKNRLGKMLEKVRSGLRDGTIE